MQTIVHFLSQGFLNIAPFFILLGLLIFVHELGHFLVARWCKVRVETFSLGFGKKIFEWKPGDTTYCISIVPLGGYVKMYGDDPTTEIPVTERSHAFLHKNVAQRIAIVLAGPLMNLFFAFALFVFINGVGEDMPAARVGDVTPASAAYNAGFRTGDKILKIDGKSVASWNDVQTKVESSINQPLKFEVLHEGLAQAETISAAAERIPNDNLLSFHKEIGRIDGLTSDSLSSTIGVIAGSPADKGGLQTLELVTAVDGQNVETYAEMKKILEARLTAGAESVQLKVRSVDSEDKPENYRTAAIASKGIKDLNVLGIEKAELYIFKVKPGTPAAAAGIQAKDRIVRVDDHPVHQWDDVLNQVKAYTPGGSPISFELLHQGKLKRLSLRPELTDTMNVKGQEEKRYTVGILSGSVKVGPEAVFVREKNPIRMLTKAVGQTTDLTGVMVLSLVRLAEGQVSAKNIGGIITIGRVASRSFEVGLSAFLKTMAIISVNLFLLNLLPVPVLDGGHLLFFSIEALRGTPVSLKKLEIAQQVGLTLLIMLMAFAFFNDISNLFAARW